MQSRVRSLFLPSQVGTAALELFAFGQREAASRGLLLVDTKYEFGKDADGNILLIDEVRCGDASVSQYLRNMQWTTRRACALMHWRAQASQDTSEEHSCGPVRVLA